MKPIHQAPVRLLVPEGFSGWWCERCEKPVEIEDALGSPARCPKCHKATAVWIPSAEPVVSEPVTSENCRKYLTAEQGKDWFAEMKAVVDAEPENPGRPDAQTKETT